MTQPFDPDAPTRSGSGIFGLPHGPEEAAVHVLPVPFEATTSFRRGTAHGPSAILAASSQVDLFDRVTGRPFEAGIYLLPIDPCVQHWNEEASACAARALGAPSDQLRREATARVNELGDELNAFVGDQTRAALECNRLPALLGGDHSTPFGAIQACAERYPGLGILHVDAHADLRNAYEGFRWSHASIMHNVLEQIGGVRTVVQVGLRDLGQREMQRIQESEERLSTVFDDEWAAARLAGQDLRPLARGALKGLPQEVYVTFDVDGLEPALCPNTGTPVPGGLTWHEAMLWLTELVRSGRRIVGLDLCEVSPGPAGDPEGQSWDAIVGARLLYRLIGFALMSRPD